ncbi:hypothetical protein [Kitasatospora sp. NPDC001547]|uniref:hypothetical protein n=1 Tax=Kitasatospora sp. NPDC001547 TaxID=3364015 RepID=UPI00367AA82E
MSVGAGGNLYVNGRPLTGQWAGQLREPVPELASDIDRLQAMRAKWLDSQAEDRTPALAGACTDPNCHTRTDRRRRNRLLRPLSCPHSTTAKQAGRGSRRSGRGEDAVLVEEQLVQIFDSADPAEAVAVEEPEEDVGGVGQVVLAGAEMRQPCPGGSGDLGNRDGW